MPTLSALTAVTSDQARAFSALPPQSAAGSLAALAESVESTLALAAQQMARGIEAALPDTDTLLATLPPGALLGNPLSYTRHLVYADPYQRFSAMVLVWRPGQSSPVHGHQVWCAYRVLRGTLTERHYTWDAGACRARETGALVREAGSTFSVPAGLRHIHALGNHSDGIAVSLHLYGVEQARIATGVNLLVDTLS